MRRAILILVSLCFFPLALLPGVVSGASPCSNSLSPPFISSGVKPNILIILDNSNSMDEDFYGNAVGSYSPASKSVVARTALQQIVTELQVKANVGVMTFTLPTDVKLWYLHQQLDFASYQSSAYCPNPDPVNNTTWPPPDCVSYCTTGVTDGSCESLCSQGNSGFSTSFTDLILQTPQNGGLYNWNDPTRARYCGLAYPKTNEWQDPANPPSGPQVYFNQAEALYTGGSWGIQYGYCSSYSTSESPPNSPNIYNFFKKKTNQSDGNSGYSTNGNQNVTFNPTDSDWALGFYNFGQRLGVYYIGPAWASSSSVAGPAPPSVSGTFQGYLNSAIGDLTGTSQFNTVYNLFNPNVDTTVPAPTNTPYMSSCIASNKNTCSYIINAGNTPTGGTLYSAYNYFSGKLKQGGTTLPTPVTSVCQKNYIIFVTDGLPDTMFNGTMSQYCFNNAGKTNNQTCSSTSNCSAPYNASCSTSTIQFCYNSAGQTNNQTCSSTSTCPASYNASCSTPAMSQVLTQLNGLLAGVNQLCNSQGTNCTDFPIKTYVLGVGLTNEAQAQLDSMAVAGGTVQTNGHAYYANDPTQMYDALETIITDLLGRVASGSSISILSEGQTQNGDNMLQGVFYPTKFFGSSATVSWPGYLYNWWFYNGTSSNNSVAYNNIREDTVHDYILELDQDYGISFVFDPQNGLSVNRYQDPNGSGDPNVFINNVGLDSLTPIWEAGKLLFQQTAASRQIYTPGNNANGSGLVNFNTSNTTLTSTTSSPLGSTSNLDPCLNGSLSNLINYISGTDIKYCSNGTTFNSTACSQNSDCSGQSNGYTSCANACRNRTVGFCSNGTSFNNTPCAKNADCSGTSYPTCTQNVWKLGDIVYSTPKVQTNYSYCSTPGTTTFSSQACSKDSDCTTSPYTGTGSCQQKESIIFVGANDGMLHAFKTGILTTSGMNPTNHQVETFTGIPDTDMGKELWAFIPQNSLPYLRCLAVPPPSSCHLYYNDLSPYVTTMVSNGVTKTVLIGGMRLGGGTVQASSAANYCFNSSGVSNGATCASKTFCQSPYNSSCSPAYPTNIPADTCSGASTISTGLIASSNPAICTSSPCTVSCSNSTTCYSSSPCTGLSSYYALDITDVQNPKLLWEFSHPFLGYAYSGPAVIHKWNSTALTDQYYVMFLSGPTGASDGSSILDVRAFVLTLNSSLGLSSVYTKDFGPQDGFGGRLFTNGMSVSNPPFTDFVFFGYSSASSGVTGPWTGGIGVLNANYPDPTSSLNPANWNWDLSTYSQIANLPVTAQVAPGQCFNNTYLFAGTGRYFFPQDNYGQNSGANYIMAIPFVRYCSNGQTTNNQPCNQNSDCTNGLFTSCVTAVPTATTLTQAATACSALQSNPSNIAKAAWLFDLDPAAADGSFLAERMVTDPTVPVVSNYVSNDIAYFVTAEPTSDPCGYGGQSRVWGLNCATGGAISDQTCNGYAVTNSSGTLYLQTSTGAIYKIDNSSSFTNDGNRATQWFTGMPPENAPPPVQAAQVQPKGGQVIQWIER